MNLSELKGKSVISMADARKVGVVDDALVGTSYQKIEALRIKAAGRGPDYVVSWENVRGIGPDAVTVVGEDALLIPDRTPSLSALPSLGSVLHSRIVSEGGKLLGTISEVSFDPVSGEVQSLSYGGRPLDALLGRERTLSRKDVIGIGPGVVTAKEVPQSRAA